MVLLLALQQPLLVGLVFSSLRENNRSFKFIAREGRDGVRKLYEQEHNDGAVMRCGSREDRDVVRAYRMPSDDGCNGHSPWAAYTGI